MINLAPRRAARLAERLEAAEKEWSRYPSLYAAQLRQETMMKPTPVNGVSQYGVLFRLQNDGLDDWRRRFLGSLEEAKLKTRCGTLKHGQLR